MTSDPIKALSPSTARMERPHGLRRRFSVVDILAVAMIALLALFAFAPSAVTSRSPIALEMKSRLAPPSLAHPFGTDEAGRDILARAVHGTRYSLGTSLAIVLAAALIGIVYGAASASAPPAVDNVMMRVVDAFLGFPALVLSLAIAAAIGRGLSSVIIALMIVWWPGYARLVRGEVLRLLERPHVEAARAIGVSKAAILRVHVLPFILPEVNVRMTTDIGYALVAVTALSFLGLGVQSPTPEWGLLIRDSRSYFGSAWWYLVVPGMLIMLTATAFSVLGDAIERRFSGGS